MTKTKRSTGKRILSVGLLILTLFALVLSLSSCGSDTEKFEKQGKNETNADFVARIIATSDTYRIRFVAAYRGYDITSEDFEDSSAVLPEANIAAAKSLMQEIIDKKNFDNSDDEATFESYKNALTKTSMESVINSESFKETAALKHSNGFPTILLVWIGKFLGLITRITGGYYVLAIMVFAIIVEVLMLPMSIKQQKNSIGMAKLRPAIAKIEKKYAGRNDQVTLRKKQEEIMALQQKEGFSPFSGCLPLIIQLIIVGFILYPIIQNPLRYVLDQSTGFSSALVSYATAPEAAGGLGLSLSSSGNVIELLASLNPANMEGIKNFALLANGEEIFNVYAGLDTLKFTAFGINLGVVPKIASILVIVPILNLVGQWFSMRLTRKWTGTGYNAMGAADNQEKFSFKMMDVLPLLMTLFIMFQVPAMIGIYWFFRSLVALGKQYIMKIVLPVPQYTAEELREIEKAEKERQKAQKEALKQQPKYRSLHYIDEDDYDELPEVKQNPSGKKISSQDAPEIKD